MIKIASLAFAALCILTGSAVSAAHAEALRWKDSNGRWVYGSTPPAGARSIERIGGKTFSRYSSSKLLSGYSGVRSSIPAYAPDARPKIVETPIVKSPAKLEAGQVLVEGDKRFRIVSCVVPVKNVGDQDAERVSVSFAFPEGTLVQAAGPETLAAGKTVEYMIGPKELPLQLRRALDAPDPPNLHAALMPKVSVTFGVAKAESSSPPSSPSPAPSFVESDSFEADGFGEENIPLPE